MNRLLTNIISGTIFYGSLIGVMDYKFNHDKNVKNDQSYNQLTNPDMIGLGTIHPTKQYLKTITDTKSIDSKFQELPKLNQYITMEKNQIMVGFEFDRKEFENYKKRIGYEKESIINNFVYYIDGKVNTCGGGIGMHHGITPDFKEHTYQAEVYFKNGVHISSKPFVFGIIAR